MTRNQSFLSACMTTCVLLLLTAPAANAQAQDGAHTDERLRLAGLGIVAVDYSKKRSEPAIAESDQGPALTERQRAVHVLNRMAFGPRPGQVEHVMEMGVENWMRQQLSPESIDNPYSEDYVASQFPTLAMSNGDLFRRFRPAYTPYKNKPPTKPELERRMKEQRDRFLMRNKVRKELRDSVYHRAIYSQRQFEEVIVAFWREHFSIDQNKDDVGYLANNWETQVIRRFAFGKFEHLLLSSARHPAMLIYLDNIVSQKPLTEREQKLVDRFMDRDVVPSTILALDRQRGLNENYARELMELHTLGVDRQYTQRDVTELARVLTGWTARWSDGSRYGGGNMMAAGKKAGQHADYGFFFNENVHDTRDKFVLGSRLRGGGEDQGILVIRALARHKYTADFISRKLCRYLLRDEPSEALVAEVAGVFRKSGGDLRKVYEAILFSDDFFYRQNHKVKFKTPFEYVVSALRVTGADVESFDALDRSLRRMGQATYGCPDPTGWYDTAEAWLDPGVLVYRWTFALELADNRIKGVRVPDALLANLPGEKLRQKLYRRVLPAGLSDRTSGIIDETLGRNPSAREMLAVLLGSPDFQQQ